MRVIDSYKETDTNFTLRRQEDRMKEEAEQLNRLRIVSSVPWYFPLKHTLHVYLACLKNLAHGPLVSWTMNI